MDRRASRRGDRSGQVRWRAALTATLLLVVLLTGGAAVFEGGTDIVIAGYGGGPSISSVSPHAGPTTGGTTVTITGTGFAGATAVKFGTTNATSFAVNSATAITAVAPPWTGGPDGGWINTSVTTPTGTSLVAPGDGYRFIPPYAVEVLNDQPRVYWRFNETKGTVANDFSDHGRVGTYSAVSLGHPGALTGDPSTAMGVGQGDLNPPTSPTVVAYRVSSGLPSGATPRTIEFWYRTALAQPGGSLVSYGGDSSHTPFDIQLEGGGTEIAVSGGTAVARAKLPEPLAARSAVIPAGSGNTFTYWTGAWHLIDVTYDGKQLTVYEDGKAVGAAIPDPGVTTTLGYPLVVGGTAGDYQEFALYPTALTASRILAHFDAASTPVAFSGASGPHVTAISPDEAADDLGQKVTVYGTDFTSGAQVEFGGHLAASTTFVSASKLEAVLPFFSLSQSGLAKVKVINNGTSNSMPFFIWTHPIGELTMDLATAGLNSCTASVLGTVSGGVISSAGHCAKEALTTTDGAAWAYAPGYSGGVCLSTGEHDASTDLTTMFGCGFAPEGLWTAAKSNSKVSAKCTCTTTPEYDWSFMKPDRSSSGKTIQEAIADGQFNDVLSAGFNQPLGGRWTAFAQKGLALENCSGIASNSGPGGYFDLAPPPTPCSTVLQPGASGGPWIDEQGFVGAVSADEYDANAKEYGVGAYFDNEVEAEVDALTGGTT
jgi:IPT/TIG domain/Concanavalin A-like lectin/glucanases superfamily